MEIKNSEAVFDISLLGQYTNESYMGTFRVKCLLSLLEDIEADKLYRQLLGDNSHLASEHVRQQAFALAQLSKRVIEAPPFWENSRLGGSHIKDANVIVEVLDKAIEAQNTYVLQKQEELKERQDRLAKLVKSKKIDFEEEEEETEQQNPEEMALNNDELVDVLGE